MSDQAKSAVSAPAKVGGTGPALGPRWAASASNKPWGGCWVVFGRPLSAMPAVDHNFLHSTARPKGEKAYSVPIARPLLWGFVLLVMKAFGNLLNLAKLPRE
jgi:hypothetical protein